ncbi:MAG: M23 family metallopeptidase, partial [Cyclobacteriaceae bacterium]
MPNKKYYYNPKTLKFEIKKISITKVLGYAFGYLSFGVLFFVGLLVLQNYIVETPLESKYRLENESLKKHKAILNERIKAANSELATLKTKDGQLYKKIFEIPKSEAALSTDGREEILAASSPVFMSWTENLTNQFTSIAKKAERSNKFFRLTASVDKSDWNKLQSAPVLQPVENFGVDQLVSGYGIRINPFHKGRYHHDGVDIASPRGANVVAAGPGKVVSVKKSDLLAGFGNYIEIDHGYGYLTRYAHLDEINVRVGEKVLKGFKIGTVGSSGGSIAPHVHYEVVINGTNVDPLQYLVQGLDSDGYAKLFVAS